MTQNFLRDGVTNTSLMHFRLIMAVIGFYFEKAVVSCGCFGRDSSEGLGCDVKALPSKVRCLVSVMEVRGSVSDDQGGEKVGQL